MIQKLDINNFFKKIKKIFKLSHEKKKLVFYSILSSGHLNVCSAVGTALLNKFADDVEVYFIAEKVWAEKLKKIDQRFKIGLIDLSSEEDRIIDVVKDTEKSLNLSHIDSIKFLFEKFFMSDVERLFETDKKSGEQIKKIKPDFILCDQILQLPAMLEHNIPYGFIISTNIAGLKIDGFPYIGSDAGIDEKEKIRKFKEDFLCVETKLIKFLNDLFEKRNVKFNKNLPINLPRSDILSIYNYPKELDYFDDELRKTYKLWQIDSPIVPSRIPAPYQLSEEFVKLPGKIIYVSLGSLFSCFDSKIQKLLDTLAELPYKYIVSKGPNGDKIKFPNDRFIGENFVDQLAVLQVADMMIAHGGNNTFTECFYFGVPAVILPVAADQINNAKRIEETGFGYQLSLMNYTQKDLKEKIEAVLNDESLKEKYKIISERIKKENKLDIVVSKLMDYMINKSEEKLSF
uniref:UDP-glycosyltransferase n=1 Tax=Polyphagotarsonemus latus TaxID=1204166 RepID=A0AAN0LVW8_9ACAR